MGNGGVRNRLDLVDVQYAQVGEPAMESNNILVDLNAEGARDLLGGDEFC